MSERNQVVNQLVFAASALRSLDLGVIGDLLGRAYDAGAAARDGEVERLKAAIDGGLLAANVELRARIKEVEEHSAACRDKRYAIARENSELRARVAALEGALRSCRWRAEEAIKDCPVKHRGTVPYTALGHLLAVIDTALGNS